MLFLLILCAPLIFYVPGWIITFLLPGATSDDILERHFERVVISMLFSGWLTLTLAELGIFSLWMQLLLVVLPGGAALYWMRRRLPPRLPPAQAGRRRLELIAFALIGMISLLLVSRPFETILGGRDAGVYANTGFAIARTGSLVQHDELLASIGQAALLDDPARYEPAQQALSNFLGVQNPQRYIATRMRAAGFFINAGELDQGRVVPQFLHLFPAWIALLTSMGGVYAGLFTPGLMSFMGAWSVGMLGRRLAGPWVGLLAFLLLSLNSVQVWFGRYSTSETTAQFLIFAGLYFFAKFQDAAPRTRDQSLPFYAALTGIAAGQLALTRIDFFLMIGPLLVYLLYCLATRRWQRGQTALAIGLGAMLLHAGLHILLIARAYFFDTGFERFKDYAMTAYLALPFLSQAQRDAYRAAGIFDRPLTIGRELTLFMLLFASLLILRRWPRPLRYIEYLFQRWRRPLLAVSALGIMLLASHAYLVRPRIIDSDILFNTRGGWNDPLTRDPRMVQQDVNDWRMSIDQARDQAGVVLFGDPEYAATAIDETATAIHRTELRAIRGAWQGPLSNQTFNWLRLQGYVGAPIALPRIFYDDGKEWWREYAEAVPPGVNPPTGLPVREKEIIPLANLVRVGWYLSPLGVLLGVSGFALWWYQDMRRATWLMFTIGLLGTFFWVRQTYGTSDQTYIYILRRFVSVTYPMFSLGIAYAIVALAGRTRDIPLQHRENVYPPETQRHGGIEFSFASWRIGSALLLAATMLLFFGWTGRPIYAHTEYAGAVAQLRTFATNFATDDVLLLRGGGPAYASARDVPDILATPLHFLAGLNAFTVKSSQPGAYADALAVQVRHWQQEGRTVYTVLSASGGNFVLPGFDLEPVHFFDLRLPEYEQLTNQKPRNVAQLSLPFGVYKLTEGPPGQPATLPFPLTATDFAAQIQGFYLPEQRPGADKSTYAWTNGDAIIRLAQPDPGKDYQIELRVAAGERPVHMQPARLCLAIQPETELWPVTSGERHALGCLTLTADMQTYHIPIDIQQIPATPTGSLLVHLESDAWIPANADAQLQDRRSVGIQFEQLSIHTQHSNA